MEKQNRKILQVCTKIKIGTVGILYAELSLGFEIADQIRTVADHEHI